MWVAAAWLCVRQGGVPSSTQALEACSPPCAALRVLSVGLFSLLLWFLLLLGDREAKEREAHMGAKAAVGRDEVCLRGPPLPPLDEPLCWLPIQAAADEDPQRRPRVLCMSLQAGMSADIRARWPASTAALWADGAGSRWAMSSLLDLGPQALVTSCVYCQEKHAVPGGHPLTIVTLGMS